MKNSSAQSINVDLYDHTCFFKSGNLVSPLHTRYSPHFWKYFTYLTSITVGKFKHLISIKDVKEFFNRTMLSVFKYLKTRKYHFRGRTMSPPYLLDSPAAFSGTYSSWTKIFFTRNSLVSRNVSSCLYKSCSPRTTFNDCGNLDISCNLSNQPLAPQK